LRLVRENGHPGWDHGGVDEIEGHSLHAILEEAPSLPEHNWVDPELILVNEVVFQQAVHEIVGAIYDEVLTRLLLELGHGLRGEGKGPSLARGYFSVPQAPVDDRSTAMPLPRG
jgi:hypothetical protein